MTITEMFAGVQTAEDLKRAYRAATKQCHPDRGGDDESMKQVNAIKDKLLQEINKNGKVSSTPAASGSAVIDEKLQAVLDRLGNMQGVKIELCGSWLWFSGNTKVYAADLKVAGCRWSKNKAAWYWHEEGYTRKGGRSYSMNEIRRKYNSTTVNRKDRDEIGAA